MGTMARFRKGMGAKREPAPWLARACRAAYVVGQARTREAQVTTFDDRERAFENQFAHDEEVRFRVRARRNRALAVWASTRLGQGGAVATAYGDDIVAAAVSGSDDDTLVRRVVDDLAKAGHAVSDAEVRAEMERQMALALQHERSA